MKHKKSVFALIVLMIVMLALQSACTIQICQQWAGYNPHPGHLPPAMSCNVIYTDGQRPTYTIMRPGAYWGK